MYHVRQEARQVALRFAARLSGLAFSLFRVRECYPSSMLSDLRSELLASGEEVEDTEMVHAIAPDGGICEVLISDAALARPAAADVAAALRVGLAQALWSP
jgi:hypothetical protein